MGEAGEDELKWFGTVNNRFHISLFPSIEEAVATYAQKEPGTIVFSVDRLDYPPQSPKEIKTFLLTDENIAELASRTGISEEHFASIREWDDSFGITSKIYLIPEKSL